MGNSKIVYYGETLIDLTGDTVEATKLRKGITAHDKKGEKITGTLADVTQATPAITVDAAGKITASATQAAGVVAAGTKSATKQLTVQAAKTVTPAASAQTAVAKGVFTTGIVTVAAVYAVIGVTYPAGSVCTCTNGTRTLTASDTSGKALFVIPSAGTWTVKAVKGDQSKSAAVEITDEGQVETVTLRYSVDIFREGEGVSSGYTIQGWFPNKNAYDSGLRVSNEKIIWATVTSVGNQIWVIPSIDVSEYSTLKIDFKCTNRYSSAQETVTIGIGPDLPTGEGTPGNFVAKTVVPYSTERAVRAVDLSGFTSTTKQYIKLSAHGITGEIYNIWFE